jgi:hypothetical protein
LRCCQVRPRHRHAAGLMKQPSILDVIQGVKKVAPAHPDVIAWWYAPPVRLRLAGRLPASVEADGSIEVVVEGGGLACARIAHDLSQALEKADVAVRLHRGEGEERQLFRVVSRPTEREAKTARPA